MPIEIEFGSQDAARQIRENPQYRGLLAESDDGRETIVRLKENAPEQAISEITARAADSKSHEADKAGQVALTRKEREQIDFSQEGVNVPKVRSIKGIATNVGVSDFLSFADLTLTVDENRQILKEAAREEKGRRGLGQDDTSSEMIDKRLAEAHHRQQEGELDQAKDYALVETDPEAQEFVTEQLPGIGSFDISFNRQQGRVVGRGTDFDRLERRHERRSSRAQTVDEQRSAKATRDPVQWSNNPNEYDYPAIDTVQPHELHEQRSENAQEQDESELAPPADTKEQWATNPDQFDWRGVDTPPGMGLGPFQSGPPDDLSLESDRPTVAKFPEEAAGGSLEEVFDIEMVARDVPASPEEMRGVGLGTPSAPGGQAYNAIEGRPMEMDRIDQEQEPPEEALQEQANILEIETNISDLESSFTDERDREGQLTEFGMETDATQHRESRTAEELASTFGIDDRDDASRGAENDSDSGEQQGFEVFGGGVRENETLF